MIVSVQRPFMRLGLIFSLALTAALISAPRLAAQANVLTISRGSSQLVTLAGNAARVAVGDPTIADYVLISPREILVNAAALGTTTMIVWGPTPTTVMATYSIEVTADAPALERQLEALFPGQNIQVSASGTLVVLSGSVNNSALVPRILQVAAGVPNAQVVNNLQVPPQQQILLSVRFAEVGQRALERLGAEIQAGRSSESLNAQAPEEGDIVGRVADGLADFFLFQDELQLSVFVDALNRLGTFRSLAEPNLLALEGDSASFLAGGEFPYPVPQFTGAQGGGGITIAFREFGVKLSFVARTTLEGNIRLRVAPEVSSLDFASGVQIGGFNVPALLSRRAQTSVELRSGQTLAIAGLLDNNAQRTNSRVPFLGDIPLIGFLFRHREVTANRTELLVLVTPRIVQPLDVSPPVPTGEPEAFQTIPVSPNP